MSLMLQQETLYSRELGSSEVCGISYLLTLHNMHNMTRCLMCLSLLPAAGGLPIYYATEVIHCQLHTSTSPDGGKWITAGCYWA